MATNPNFDILLRFVREHQVRRVRRGQYVIDKLLFASGAGRNRTSGGYGWGCIMIEFHHWLRLEKINLIPTNEWMNLGNTRAFHSCLGAAMHQVEAV